MRCVYDLAESHSKHKGLQSRFKAQSHFYPLPLPLTPSKQGGGVRGRNGIGPKSGQSLGQALTPLGTDPVHRMAFLPTLQSERRRGPQCNIASSLPRVRSGEQASPTSYPHLI